jgi:hypothetical protein
MKYLIYTCCFETPHFETEMEIAKMAIDKGHEVYFLVCEADLKTCFINPEHSKSICMVCQSKVKNGLSYLKIPANRILKFSKSTTEAFDFPYFESIAELKSYRYQDSDIGLAVASSLISSTRDYQFDVNQNRNQIINGLKTAILVHDNGAKILDEIKPDVVIMFNGRFLECRPIMRLCEQRGIDFYTHERGGQLDRYMLRKNSIPHSLEYTFEEIEELWAEGGGEKEKIGTDFFLDRRNRVTQSWSSFTEEQKIGALPAGYNSDKVNIGIFNSSMDEYEGIEGFHNPVYIDDHDAIEKICTSFLTNENFHFYLRVHPNLKGLDNTQNREIDKLAVKFKNLTVIPAESAIDTYALMEAVNLVVTFGSTMGIEAMFWNKPAILVGRAFYEKLSGVMQPKSHEDVLFYINNIPASGFRNSAVKYGYWGISYGFKFQYFNPEGLFSGNFLGKRIRASFYTRVLRKSRDISRNIMKSSFNLIFI